MYIIFHRSNNHNRWRILKMYYCRGDIFLVGLSGRKNSSVQTGLRPAVIVSNYKNNILSPIVTLVPITTACKKDLPTHVQCEASTGYTHGTILCEQIITADKKDLHKYVGKVSQKTMNQVDNALRIQLEL